LYECLDAGLGCLMEIAGGTTADKLEEEDVSSSLTQSTKDWEEDTDGKANSHICVRS